MICAVEKQMPNQLKRDPTRTTTIRKQFMADMKRRFKRLSKAIQELVVTDDAFGLKEQGPLIIQQVVKQAWRFQNNTQKIKSYRKWLKQQVDADILVVDPTFRAKPWLATYIESSYRKGTVHAYTELNREALADVPAFYRGSQTEFLRSSFAAPETVSKLEFLYTRAFTELEGITHAMDQQMSRILANGLANGHGAIKIARNLRDNVDKMTNTRALVLARTEVIAAHAEGQLDAFERLGVKEVGIRAEWSTAGDDLVCPLCSELEGVVMTIKEARGLIPRHPNCRCAWIPALDSRKEKGQLWGRKKDTAVAKSIRAEGGFTKTGRFKTSLKEARRRSVWTGKEI